MKDYCPKWSLCQCQDCKKKGYIWLKIAHFFIGWKQYIFWD